MEPFFTELWHMDLENSNNFQFPLIFVGLAAHIENIFGIHIYAQAEFWV
jgi:hypothetical protein